MHVHAFSPMEIDYGVLKTGLPLGAYLQMMKDEGLGSIPGTAAEILDDRIRQQLSPNKLPVARWVEIITMAHELGIPTTSTMMYGHVEEPADRKSTRLNSSHRCTSYAVFCLKTNNNLYAKEPDGIEFDVLWMVPG